MGNFRSKQDLSIKEFEKFLENQDFREKTKMEIMLDYEGSHNYIQAFIVFNSDRPNEEVKVHMFTNNSFHEFVHQIKHLYHLLTIKYHYQQIQAISSHNSQPAISSDAMSSILEEGAPCPIEEAAPPSHETQYATEEYTRIESLIAETQLKISEILNNSDIVM